MNFYFITGCDCLLKVVLALMYLPDRPHSACSPQTCHSYDVFPQGPGAYEGYELSWPQWWKRGVCILQEKRQIWGTRHMEDLLLMNCKCSMWSIVKTAQYINWSVYTAVMHKFINLEEWIKFKKGDKNNKIGLINIIIFITSFYFSTLVSPLIYLSTL